MSMATKGSPRRRKCHRRRNKRAPPSWDEPTPSGPTGVHHIPDHLLELVLLRVGTPLALLRAASTCKRWRRIIFTDDATFLARFRRSLRAAHVPGHYHVDGNNGLVFVPDPSAADALDRRHFSLDFLPGVPDGSLPWELADSRGGLLLLYRRDVVYYRMGRMWYGDAGYLQFPDMVVCDPLTRRCQGILYWEEMWSDPCLGLFLLDGEAADGDESTGGGSIGMSNFRVVAMVYESHFFGHNRGAARACVFSSGRDGGWRQESEVGGDVPVSEYYSISFAGRAGSSLFWRMEREDAVLALDDATMQFSLVTFLCTVVGTPDGPSYFRVIGGDDGAARIVRVMANNDLTVFQRLQSSGAGEWVVEKLVRLPGREETVMGPDSREAQKQPAGEERRWRPNSRVSGPEWTQ